MRFLTEEKGPEYFPEILKEKGFGWRVGASIFIVFGWLAFLIIWLFFYAGKLDNVFQNIAVLLVSIIVGVGLLAGIWASWGIRYAAKHKGEPGYKMHMKPRWSMAINAIAGVGWLIFLVIWLFSYADKYSGYQNLAIFIASILVWGAIAGSAWFVHWMRTWMRAKGSGPAMPPQPPSNP